MRRNPPPQKPKLLSKDEIKALANSKSPPRPPKRRPIKHDVKLKGTILQRTWAKHRFNEAKHEQYALVDFDDIGGRHWLAADEIRLKYGFLWVSSKELKRKRLKELLPQDLC